MTSSNKKFIFQLILVGVFILFLVLGGKTKPKVQVNTTVDTSAHATAVSPQVMAGIYVLKDPDSNDDYKNKFTIWRISDDYLGNQEINEKTLVNFNVIADSWGITTLVEKGTGRVWIRKPYYSFEYTESGKNRKLTLYELPDGSCHACGGKVQGVFGEKDSKGNFLIVKVDESDGDFDFGQLDSIRSNVPNVNIGSGKKALILPRSSMSMAGSYSGEWLLEYTNLKLTYIQSFGLGFDNFGACGIENQPPCVSHQGILDIDRTQKSSEGYYDIVVKQTGTDFDSDYNIINVTPITRFRFVGGSYKYES